jgi:hypothetical protein
MSTFANSFYIVEFMYEDEYMEYLTNYRQNVKFWTY